VKRSEAREEPVSIGEAAVAKLIAFFRLLDTWDREAKAMQKTCSTCSEGVQYSIVVMISTVGVSPRVQQSSPAVLFCDHCFRELSERLCSDKLRIAVNSALTELNERLRERSTAQKSMFD